MISLTSCFYGSDDGVSDAGNDVCRDSDLAGIGEEKCSNGIIKMFGIYTIEWTMKASAMMVRPKTEQIFSDFSEVGHAERS